MIKIVDRTKCCGCGACEQICPKGCIEMIFDTEGCEYPETNDKDCLDCGLCSKACPVLNVALEEERPQRAYLVQHCDASILSESTSGGAFSALAQVLIAHGGIVFGAGYLRGEETLRAEGVPSRLKVGHFGIDSVDELWRFRNSKYTQSVCAPSYPEVKAELKSGRDVLFIGTPCQCEGLLGYLGGAPANLRVADVVCRAVPARAVFARYLEWLDSKTQGEVETVLFRDKSRFGYRYSSMKAFSEADELYSQGVETDPYLRAFFSNVCDRPICYECPFKKRYRASDLTCWDCFDVYKFNKGFDDNRGATRVLVQSEKGQKLLNAAKCYARIEEIDAERAVEGVREMFESVDKNPKRDEFMSDAASMDGAELIDKWFPDSMQVKVERYARHACERLGIYDPVKRLVKSMIPKKGR